MYEKHCETMGDDHRIIMVSLDHILDWWLNTCITCGIVLRYGDTYDQGIRKAREHAGVRHLGVVQE